MSYPRFRGAEYRAQVPATVEVKGDTVVGYAAVFGSASIEEAVRLKQGPNAGKVLSFTETISPGAFSAKLAGEHDLRMLIDHETRLILGRESASMMRVGQDSTGLSFECRLPDTSYARDLRVSMDRGDIRECSFGFWTRQDKWSRGQDGISLHRDLIELDVFECSIVTFPVFEATWAELRSMAQETLEDFLVSEDLDQARRRWLWLAARRHRTGFQASIVA